MILLTYKTIPLIKLQSLIPFREKRSGPPFPAWESHRRIGPTEEGFKIIKLNPRFARQLDWNVLRWFVVGSLTVGIDWTIFVNLYRHIHSVALTNLVSGSFSIAFNYIAHHQWTFRNNHHHLQSGPRYIGLLFVGYLLNTILVKAFLVAGVGPGIAKLLAAVIQAPVSFFGLKLFVFKTRGDIS